MVADSTSVNLYKAAERRVVDLARTAAPRAPGRPLRAQQLPHRPLHRRVPGERARLRSRDCRCGRTAGAARRNRGGAAAHPRQLPHRQDARPRRADRRRSRRRSGHGLGSGALRRRRPGRPHRQRGRLRSRLRLQVPERRTGSPRFRLGAPAARRARDPAARGLARPCRPVRLHADYRPGGGRRPLPVRHSTGALAGGARMRSRDRPRRGTAGRHASAARQVVGALRGLHRRRRDPLRRPRTDAGLASRRGRARQPGLLSVTPATATP